MYYFILFHIMFLEICCSNIFYSIFLVLVNIFTYIVRIMTTQNYATVPYLFLFFNQGRVRDFQIPVLLNMK